MAQGNRAIDRSLFLTAGYIAGNLVCCFYCQIRPWICDFVPVIKIRESRHLPDSRTGMLSKGPYTASIDLVQTTSRSRR
jgi:hypothetical protein